MQTNKAVQGKDSNPSTPPTCEPHRPHDERIEAACFDAKIQALYGESDNDILDMSKQLASYLRAEPPQTPSAIRLLVYELGDLHGKTVLDLGCGTGDLSVILAKRGARVIGIDVSQASVQIAHRRAEVNQVSELMSANVMSAYNLEFVNDTFDLMVGKGILHHLDLVRSRDEILRVLKPGGQGFFIEPICFSQVIRFIRDIIPITEDRETPDERQLSRAEVDLFCQGFRDIKLKEIGLFSSRLERFFPRIPGWLRMLYRFDFWALTHYPWLRKNANMIIISVTKG